MGVSNCMASRLLTELALKIKEIIPAQATSG